MKTRQTFAIILTVLLLLGSLSGLKDASASADRDVLYEFDLKSFLASQPDSKAAYDYLKLATAYQGIVNRDQPHIYYYSEVNPAAKKAGMDMDRYWMNKLKSDGKYLSDFDSVPIGDLFSLLDLFKSRIEGIVLWDDKVPATANVASTIAGVSNLLPVRYDVKEGSVYNELVVKRALFPVTVNLVDKFTGQGLIPDTELPSTGSAKNDAYLWAKVHYLDTGLTNPALMANAIDGASWVSERGGKLNALMYSAALPKRMETGQKMDIIVTVENTGSQTWSRETNDRLASKPDNQFVWENLNGGFSGSLTDQRVFLGSGEQIEAGEKKTFRYTIAAPGTPGNYVFSAGMVRDGEAWMGDALTRTIEVVDGEASPDMPRGGELNAGMYSAYLPDMMQINQEIDVAITVENTGENSWGKATNDRLASEISNQFIWKNMDGFSNGPGDQRVYLDENEVIQTGERRTFHFTLKAPGTAGDYTFAAHMVRDGVSWIGENLSRVITVTEEAVQQGEPVETVLHPDPNEGPGEEELIVHENFVYPDLYNSQLPNADYYIANRAFFFDLSPDKTSIPNDDRGQPLGTDYNTLIELLRSQNRQADGEFITIGGFVPWFIKYTNYIDPTAALDPVAAEWTYVDIVSRYNAQLDADACCYIGLSNASVYERVPLNEQLKQNNDKGANGTVYDQDRKYVSFYMGDFDASAWTSSVLPILWDDPRRGELPLAWPLAPMLSERIPHVFNYMYETMSANDYFVAGDNGAGYLNPMMLQADNRPDGLPPYLAEWEQYNRHYYNRFDLDITGFLISGNSWSVPAPVQEVYSRLSPLGVGTNGGFDANVVNGTPFALVQGSGMEETDAAKYGEELASLLKGNQQFYNLRIILTKPTVIADAVQYVKDHYPGLKFDVVDPYTYFRLYKESEGWKVKTLVTYNSPNTLTAVQVDGAVHLDEWADAQEIVVSSQSEDVTKYGTVWSNGSLLEAKYRVKWDQDNLYILEQRQDDKLQFTETGNKMYLSDATLLFLDLDHNKLGSTFRDGDYAVFMTAGGPDGNPHIYMREGRNQGVTEYAFTEGEIASSVNGNSYVMEAAIPWSKLQRIPFAPEAGKSIGMSLLATHGPDQWGQIMWVGNGDDQSKWADMKFTDNTPDPGSGGETPGGSGGETPGGSGGETPGGSFIPAEQTNTNPAKTEFTLAAGASGTVKLGGEIELDIPAGSTDQSMKVTIEKLADTAGLMGPDDVLLSAVFELLKDTNGKFAKPLKLKLTFDPSKLKQGQHAMLAYYDEAAKKWVEIESAVSGSTITAEVDHFTKFAVIVAKEGMNPEKVIESGITFTDTSGHWAAGQIAEAAARGIVSGYADGSFKPGAPVTRAEFAVMLVRAFKPEAEGAELNAKDAGRIGAWAKEALSLAAGAGIINGYEDGTLRPDAVVTRAEALVMAARAAGLQAAKEAKTSFADDGEIAPWAKGYVAAAAGQGLAAGTGNNRFAPNERSSRAEALTLLMNLLHGKETAENK